MNKILLISLLVSFSLCAENRNLFSSEIPHFILGVVKGIVSSSNLEASVPALKNCNPFDEKIVQDIEDIVSKLRGIHADNVIQVIFSIITPAKNVFSLAKADLEGCPEALKEEFQQARKIFEFLKSPAFTSHVDELLYSGIGAVMSALPNFRKAVETNNGVLFGKTLVNLIDSTILANYN